MNWIKLEEKLPKLDEEILLYQENPIAKTSEDPKGFIEIGSLISKKETSSGFYYEFVDGRYEELFNVSHWQPLPKAPK